MSLHIVDSVSGQNVVTVKEDDDGLGLVEVKTSVDISNGRSMIIDPGLAKLLAEAICQIANNIIKKNPEEHSQG